MYIHIFNHINVSIYITWIQNIFAINNLYFQCLFIIEMLHPHNEDKVKFGDKVTKSVNATIDVEMEVEIIYVKKWTGVLQRAGCPAEGLKSDWNSAYKHIEAWWRRTTSCRLLSGGGDTL